MLTLSQLEQYLSKAAWVLKGPVDAADFKVKDDAPKQAFNELIDEWERNRKELHNDITRLMKDQLYKYLAIHRFYCQIFVSLQSHLNYLF